MTAEHATGSGSLRPIMPIALRTERLRLEPAEPSDRTALHRLWTDREVRRFLWDDRLIDLATVDGVLERSSASFAAEGFGLFALREAGRGALIGVAGIHRLAPGAEPELIYSLAPARWGRGLATEASRAVITDAFARLGFARVLARTDTPNLASIEVMKRLGMSFAGEAEEDGRPTVSYTLARDEWRGRER
jgi:RimJ/RimL family protein N-acetyltransferase